MSEIPNTKVELVSVELIDGKPCVVLLGSGARLYFPAMGLHAVFADMERQVQAYANRNSVKIGDWIHQAMTTPQTLRVASTDGGTVAVILDEGLPKHQTVSLSRDYAQQLAEALAEAVEQLQPPGRSHYCASPSPSKPLHGHLPVRGL